MLAHVRKGDTVVVHEISRLACNTADRLALVEQLTNKGVATTFQKEGLSFTGDKDSAMNKNAVDDARSRLAFELSMINERRAKGQVKARAEGKHMGNSAKLSTDRASTLRTRAAAGEGKTDLASKFGVSQPIFIPQSGQRPNRSSSYTYAHRASLFSPVPSTAWQDRQGHRDILRAAHQNHFPLYPLFYNASALADTFLFATLANAGTPRSNFKIF